LSDEIFFKEGKAVYISEHGSLSACHEMPATYWTFKKEEVPKFQGKF
jgi:hypothetical protein